MKIRSEAGCINEHDIIKLKGMKTFHVDVNVMGETMTRKMVKVNVKDQMMFVDTVTGTLYDPNTLQSSSSRIYIEKVYRA